MKLIKDDYDPAISNSISNVRYFLFTDAIVTVNYGNDIYNDRIIIDIEKMVINYIDRVTSGRKKRSARWQFVLH